jgi:hypothetical protein
MDNERLDAPTGRDIAGGWLLCAIIGALALILTSVFHGGMSAPASAATIAAAGPSAGDTSCAAAAQAPRLRVLARFRQHRRCCIQTSNRLKPMSPTGRM